MWLGIFARRLKIIPAYSPMSTGPVQDAPAETLWGRPPNAICSLHRIPGRLLVQWEPCGQDDSYIGRRVPFILRITAAS